VIIKVNKINFHNSFPFYHRSLPLYRRRPNNRRKNILPGESAKNVFATIRGVGTQGTHGSTSGHYQEGAATGGFKWGAIDGSKDTGRKLGEIRNVYITPKKQDE
jgi:hypothetical protein